jgi:hypothetical protein
LEISFSKVGWWFLLYSAAKLASELPWSIIDLRSFWQDDMQPTSVSSMPLSFCSAVHGHFSERHASMYLTIILGDQGLRVSSNANTKQQRTSEYECLSHGDPPPLPQRHRTPLSPVRDIVKRFFSSLQSRRSKVSRPMTRINQS